MATANSANTADANTSLQDIKYAVMAGVWAELQAAGPQVPSDEQNLNLYISISSVSVASSVHCHHPVVQTTVNAAKD